MNSIQQMLHAAGVTRIDAMKGDQPHLSVLAENVEVTKDNLSGGVRVEFDFLCPKCGQRHWAVEYDTAHGLFQTVAWQLRCGWVAVRMPWARTPERDRKSVYGKGRKT